MLTIFNNTDDKFINGKFKWDEKQKFYKTKCKCPDKTLTNGEIIHTRNEMTTTQ